MMQGTMTTIDALRAEGFVVNYSYVRYLLQNRIIAPPDNRVGGVLLWDDADIQRLRGELLRRGRGPDESELSPHVRTCSV